MKLYDNADEISYESINVKWWKLVIEVDLLPPLLQQRLDRLR